jgi:dTDP-4-amino-4,6-dideoxygalactose transaminase
MSVATRERKRSRTLVGGTLLRVPLADLVKQYHDNEDEVNAAIRDVLNSAQFILGPKVQQLERDLADYSCARFGVGVNSGTDALLLALVAHGVQPGDEVITSPFTFVATAEAIALVGAVPVFADIDLRTYNLDPAAAAAAITSKTRAIMPVDLFGQMADRDAFVSLAEKHGLTLIWDAAQAIGAEFADRKLGEWPGSATLSFFPTKNLGGCGDGGMILTNDEAVRDGLVQYRFHGSGGGYIYARVGYCSRLDAIQAAILDIKLRHLSFWNETRRHHAAVYHARLQDACVTLPFVDPRAYHIYHQFTIRTPQRKALQAYLKENEVDSGIYYPLALHQQEAYTHLGYKTGDFPNAERAAQEVLSLPVHAQLTDDQVEYVADLVCKFDR